MKSYLRHAWMQVKKQRRGHNWTGHLDGSMGLPEPVSYKAEGATLGQAWAN